MTDRFIDSSFLRRQESRTCCRKRQCYCYNKFDWAPAFGHVEKPDNDTKVHTVAVLLCVEYIALQIVTTENPQGHSPCEYLKWVLQHARKRESIENVIIRIGSRFCGSDASVPCLAQNYFWDNLALSVEIQQRRLI